jgi:cell division protein FtsL
MMAEKKGQGVSEADVVDFTQEDKGKKEVQIDSKPVHKGSKLLKVLLSILAALVILFLIGAIIYVLL